MTDTRKKENLFAKLAAQQARPDPETAAVVTEARDEDGSTPPALPEAMKSKPSAAKKKADPVKGKRDNPDYCQANAYVPKKLRKAVEKALLDIDGLDYSSLIEDLLWKWVKSRGVAE